MQNTIAIQHYENINAIEMGDCNTQALLHMNINAIQIANTRRKEICDAQLY